MPSRIRVQIYEVQRPEEAEEMIRLGVDHVGSVLLSEDRWQDRTVRRTVAAVKRLGAKSSLIPLFDDEEILLRTLEYHRPDIVHFCDLLEETDAGKAHQERLCALQAGLKKRFPEVRIMRSIPIPPGGAGNEDWVLAAAGRFAPVSDYFLTDTLMPSGQGASAQSQPVCGYVGITGRTCDWDLARVLVERSPVPVVLAGGISPENAAAGIAAVRPFGVDSCTRTNAVDAFGKPVRFKKDPRRVRDLIEAVRKAEAALQAIDGISGSAVS